MNENIRDSGKRLRATGRSIENQTEPGMLPLNEGRLHSKNILNSLHRKDVSSWSSRNYSGLVQHDNIISEASREIQIVDHSYGYDVGLTRKFLYGLHELNL